MTTKPASIGLAFLLALAFAGCGNVSPLDPNGHGGSGGGTTSGAGGGGMSGSGGQGGARVALKHRASAAACAQDRSPSTCPYPDTSTSPVSACQTDADCVAGRNGRCEQSSRVAFCGCSYDTCFADGDCNTGGPCSCRTVAADTAPATTPANLCLQGNCRVDADCGPGGSCSPTYDFSCGPYSGIIGYYCHKAADGCLDDADCTAGDCRYNPATGAWACATGACAG
jgi:hypothetical protein